MIKGVYPTCSILTVSNSHPFGNWKDDAAVADRFSLISLL